jgi:hypothetical protein
MMVLKEKEQEIACEWRKVRTTLVALGTFCRGIGELAAEKR